MANKNKYMGKVVPLEETRCLKEARFSFSNKQTLFGRPWRRTFRFSKDRVGRLNFPCLEQESGQ